MVPYCITLPIIRTYTVLKKVYSTVDFYCCTVLFSKTRPLTYIKNWSYNSNLRVDLRNVTQSKNVIQITNWSNQWKLIMFFFSSTEVECLWRKWMSKSWIFKAKIVPILLNGFPTMWRQLFAIFHPVAQKWLQLSLETPLQFKVLWSGSYKTRFKITCLRPIHLYMIFEKSILKNLLWCTGSLTFKNQFRNWFF